MKRENIAKDRKVIPDPIDDRKFQEWKGNREVARDRMKRDLLSRWKKCNPVRKKKTQL